MTTPLVLEHVFFPFDSSELTEPSKRALDRVADSLKAWPGVPVEVGGHTDTTGVEAYNHFLSLQPCVVISASPTMQLSQIGTRLCAFSAYV